MVKGYGNAMVIDGLSNLIEIRGSLSLDDVEFFRINLNNFERVGGDLSKQKTHFDKSIKYSQKI